MNLAQLCVDLGAEIDSIVLRSAVQGSHWDFVNRLIKMYNVDPCIMFLDINEQVQTPLQFALKQSELDSAILLLEKGVEIFQLDHFDWITHPNAKDFYQFSLLRNIQWNDIRDLQGRTIAHFLASCKHQISNLQLILMIIESVSSLSEDNNGDRPVQVLISSMTEQTPLSLIASFLLLDTKRALKELISCTTTYNNNTNNTNNSVNNTNNTTTDDTIFSPEVIIVNQLKSQILESDLLPEQILNVQTNSGLSLLDKALFLNHEPVLELFLHFNESKS